VEVSGTLCSDRYLLDHIRIDSDRKLEEATIERLMASGSIEKTAFDDSFLQHTAFEQVVLVVEKTLNNLGALCCVTRMPGGAYRASLREVRQRYGSASKAVGYRNSQSNDPWFTRTRSRKRATF